MPPPFHRVPAAFSLDTPLAFDVQPASGMLPPAPADGSDGPHAGEPPLRVSFTNRWVAARCAGGPQASPDPQLLALACTHRAPALPPLPLTPPPPPRARTRHPRRQVGKMQRGQLLIRTPSAEYRYTVVGRAPSYAPPDVPSRLLQPTAAFNAHASASSELQAELAAEAARRAKMLRPAAPGSPGKPRR